MKKFTIIITLACTLMFLAGCDPDTNTDPADPHFRMTVNGNDLSALPENVTYFVYSPTSSFGVFAAGGTVVYNSIAMMGVVDTGTYQILANGESDGGLRLHFQDSIYYINETHGSGTLHVEIFDYVPGTVREMKGTFSGTAETDHGNTVTITNGDYYYHQP